MCDQSKWVNDILTGFDTDGKDMGGGSAVLGSAHRVLLQLQGPYTPTTLYVFRGPAPVRKFSEKGTLLPTR